MYIARTYLFKQRYPDDCQKLTDKMKEHPSLRFGQVMCNDVCPDYRDENPSEKTRDIMDLFFNDCPCDPFYEEPEKTYHRLIAQDIFDVI